MTEIHIPSVFLSSDFDDFGNANASDLKLPEHVYPIRFTLVMPDGSKHAYRFTHRYRPRLDKPPISYTYQPVDITSRRSVFPELTIHNS